MKRRAPAPGQTGFTMIETLILMSFILLLATFAFPAIQKSMRRARIEGCAQQVATLMHQARFDAIKRGRPAFVEIVGVRAVLARAVSNDDLNRAQVLGEVACPNGVSLTSAPGTKVVFDPNGANRPDSDFTDETCGVDVDDEICVADTEGNRMRARVTMPATGRIELEKSQAGNWYANGEAPDTETGAWRFQ